MKIKLKPISNAKYIELRDAVDAKKKGGKIKTLKVKMTAVHGSRINDNNWFYPHALLKESTQSFVEPYNKPVMANHMAHYGEVLGRITDASYVEYEDISLNEAMDSLDPAEDLSKIRAFTQGDIHNAAGYKGLGHISVVAEITNEDAIDKILKKEYLTLSIGASTENAICSECGKDNSNKSYYSEDAEDERCRHHPGMVKDGKSVYFISGKLKFKELSFVNTPADENATIESIEDSVMFDTIDAQDMEVLDFTIDGVTNDSKNGDNNLKIKFSDFTKKENLNGDIADILKAKGLETSICDEEAIKKIRKNNFLLGDDKRIPIHDGAHVIAAYDLIDLIEEGTDRDSMLGILDKKYAKEFGKKTKDEAIAALVQIAKETQAKEDNGTATSNVKIDDATINSIADVMVDKLKTIIDTHNDESFLSTRNDVLEKEVTALEAENNDLHVKIKDGYIGQILIIEDRQSDDEYKATLSARTLDSICDKLNDLNANVDTKKIVDTKVNLDDAADGHGVDPDAKKDDKKDDGSGSALSVTDVRSEYKNLIRSVGLKQASAYVQKLKDDGKLPANFTF